MRQYGVGRHGTGQDVVSQDGVGQDGIVMFLQNHQNKNDSDLTMAIP